MDKGKILVVDDEKSIQNALQDILEDEGFTVFTAGSGEEALKFIHEEIPDLVLLDIWLPGIDGLETLTRMKASFPDIAVIMISGHGTIETAVQSTRLGALNFIEKPLSLHRVLLEVRQALKQKTLEIENRELRKKMQTIQKMVGTSKIIADIRKLISTAGPTNGRVLISGESGTGKELIAKEIHRQSLRCDKAFIEVNCAAIPEELIESELFGHEKGSFTHATYMKKGKFELADGGTLFLDEVGDMSLKTQAKVLRVLEEGKIERVGGSKTIPVDVRVIAASNKDLQKEIQENRFREDLFYRLNVIPIHIQPLRNHPDDIPLLVKHFIKIFCDEYGKPLKTVDENAMELLESYTWPGNIRELKNEIERLVIMTPGKTIRATHLGEQVRQRARMQSSELEIISGEELKTAREKFERSFIEKRLQAFKWNVTQTAESLGIERSNLHRKMKQLGISASIDKPEKSSGKQESSK